MPFLFGFMNIELRDGLEAFHVSVIMLADIFNYWTLFSMLRTLVTGILSSCHIYHYLVLAKYLLICRGYL